MVKQQVGIQKENVGGRESCPFEKVRILRHSQEDRGWEGHLLELRRTGWGRGMFLSPDSLSLHSWSSACWQPMSSVSAQPKLLCPLGPLWPWALKSRPVALSPPAISSWQNFDYVLSKLDFFPHLCLCVTQAALKDMRDDDGGPETPQRESEPVVPPASTSHLWLRDWWCQGQGHHSNTHFHWKGWWHITSWYKLALLVLEGPP